MEISTLRNALVKQTKPNDFLSYNSGSLSHKLTKNFNFNQQIPMQLIKSPSLTQTQATPENFDINAQLKKLLIVSQKKILFFIVFKIKFEFIFLLFFFYKL